MSDAGARAISVLGLGAMIAIAWVFSSDRSRVPWPTVAWGLGLQLVLGVLLLKTPLGSLFFAAMNAIVSSLMAYTQVGVDFVFGALVDTGFSIVVNVLPIIVFMGSVFAVLYHLGVMQRVVDSLAVVLARTLRISGAESLAAVLARMLRISGAESLAAVSNLFVGMTESALIVRPYLERMTRSELFVLMTLGMATVAGSVLLAYVGMLGGGDYAGHLATASLLSAPAGILLAKVMVPETETPVTFTRHHAAVERSAVNVIDAAAQGGLAGLRLAAYVGALLIAFVAGIALLNDALGTVGGWVGVEDLTMQGILGVLLAPLAWLMGVPWQDAQLVGGLMGIKTVLNEFIAYQGLAEAIASGSLSTRSAVIASYALCGFANFGSLAILLGGIGGLAPGRRSEVAQLGLRSILAGSLATFMTGCIAGILI